MEFVYIAMMDIILNQNKCIEIPISKCRQYDGNTEKCTVCLDGSSPSDGICKQRNNWMDGCVKYEDDDTIKNVQKLVIL